MLEPAANWTAAAGKLDSPLHHSHVFEKLINPLQCTFAFGVPSEEICEAIAAHTPIVELGAGTGYWAAMLARRGADVPAFDCR